LPERADLGELFAVQWTRTRLCRLLRDYFRSERGRNLGELGESSPGAPGLVRVGTDVVFHYDPADRLARVTPDLYVIEGLGYEEQLRSFRVYERGLRPELVIHLVDTVVTPEDGLMMHFLRLGVRDVILYDPLWFQQSSKDLKGRRLLWHYRRERLPAPSAPTPSSSTTSGPTPIGGEVMRLLSQEHPGRVYLGRYKLWLIHRGGADLRVYVGEEGEPPAESDCLLLPEERDSV
jgi:hypothetical protein